MLTEREDQCVTWYCQLVNLDEGYVDVNCMTVNYFL